MVLIILVLLLCGRAAESKIVYMRPAARNDTATMATTATTMATTATAAAKDDDADDSVPTKTDAVGVQFYAPPVVHATAADAFGRHVRPHHRRHREPHRRPPAYPGHRPVHRYVATAWDQPGADADGVPILMGPLSYAQQRAPGPTAARAVEYADPAAASLAFLAAETDDAALLDNLPALRLALRHAAAAAGPAPSVHGPPHHRHVVHGPHQRYAAAGPYTQVPFLYNLPTPPVQRDLAPAEYDLVTRFNRLLLRQRLRPVADDVGEDRDEAAAAGPVAKPKKNTTTGDKKKRKMKKKKKKKKKTTTTTTTPRPAPVEEEQQEEDEDDGEQQHREQDERAEDEQPASEEQESQNVATSQQLPENTAIHEAEVDFPNEMDSPSRLSEQFGGDLTFEDGNGERVEFQLHGLGGPESYKFGFDTGKGTNRQFRYEERDSTGNVHGHYGYLDNEGKMQVYNYSSHPELGFHSQKSEALET